MDLQKNRKSICASALRRVIMRPNLSAPIDILIEKSSFEKLKSQLALLNDLYFTEQEYKRLYI